MITVLNPCWVVTITEPSYSRGHGTDIDVWEGGSKKDTTMVTVMVSEVTVTTLLTIYLVISNSTDKITD